MIHTLKSLGGMFVAPHHLAAQAGRDVLRDGGNAVEAMVAAAAAVAVVYPHMNAIGGDGFWLIHEPPLDKKTNKDLLHWLNFLYLYFHVSRPFLELLTKKMALIFAFFPRQ